jgi:hypothetical protein
VEPGHEQYPTGAQRVCTVEDGYPQHGWDEKNLWITHLDCADETGRKISLQTMRLQRLDRLPPELVYTPRSMAPAGSKRPPMLQVEDMRTSRFHKHWLQSKTEPIREKRLMESIYSEPKP